MTIEAKRNDNYYGNANFDEISVLSVSDVVARQNALNSGNVDYIDRPDLKTVSLLKRNPGIEIEQVTGFGHYVAPMNTTMAPFDNKDVRLALKYAIDREELVKKILLGFGSLPAGPKA